MPNRWQIFEFMKTRYQETGKIPEASEILDEFGARNVHWRELCEAIYEFDRWHTEMVGRVVS